MLRPEVLPHARTWLHIVTEDLGLKVRVIETLRSEARQKWLKSEGKSQVTFGWHNVGLALDFGIFDDKGEFLKDDRSGLYTKCGRIAEALDFIWGGRWERFKDYGHLEWHPGMTLQQFLNGRKGDLVS